MNDKRKYIVVARYPLGGIRTYLLYNYKRKLQSGASVVLISQNEEYLLKLHEEMSAMGNARMHLVPGGEKDFILGVRKIIRQERRSDDSSLIIHSQGLRCGTEVVLANYGLKVPHLITLHDVLVPENDVTGRMRFLKKWLIGSLVSKANAIVAVSEDCRENHLENLSGLSKNKGRLHTISNGIDVSKIQNGCLESELVPVRKSLNLSTETSLLGFLGRFMPQKGFIWLLDALQILQKRQTCPPFHLVAYGKGDYIREYKREVAARDGLQERISFMDPVSNVGPVLKQLDVMVMPSRWEACGLLAMEALVLGIPVVGSDCIGLREVLRGTPARTVPVDDVQALADALEMELKSPRRAEFEQYVPEAIRRFDVNRSIEAFDQLVEEVMVH